MRKINNKYSKLLNPIKLSGWKNWLLLLIIIFLFSYYISKNWYCIMIIQGNSMYPAYHNLQFVILDCHSKDYTYGDVIGFQCKELNHVLVKRIAACPGDTVKIEQGTLYVNGVISEVYSEENLFEYAGNLEKMITLGIEQYIVIGDNISESKDSRYNMVGYVATTDIIGKIINKTIK